MAGGCAQPWYVIAVAVAIGKPYLTATSASCGLSRREREFRILVICLTWSANVGSACSLIHFWTFASVWLSGRLSGGSWLVGCKTAASSGCF